MVPKGYHKAMACEHAQYWRAAIALEMAGLIALRVWTIILQSDMPPMPI